MLDLFLTFSVFYQEAELRLPSTDHEEMVGPLRRYSGVKNEVNGHSASSCVIRGVELCDRHSYLRYQLHLLPRSCVSELTPRSPSLLSAADLR